MKVNGIRHIRTKDAMETLRNNDTQHEVERHQRDMDMIRRRKCSVCDHVDNTRWMYRVW